MLPCRNRVPRRRKRLPTSTFRRNQRPLSKRSFLSGCARLHCRKIIPAWYPGPVDKKEPFIKLVPIDVEKSKRLGRGKIPCPMCQPNKFLSGFLVWFPRLQAVAVIGHCCADKETAAVANREERKTREREEDYLLAKIPLIPQALRAIYEASAAAEEALRVYRHFRNKGSGFCRKLKEIDKADGILAV